MKNLSKKSVFKSLAFANLDRRQPSSTLASSNGIQIRSVSTGIGRNPGRAMKGRTAGRNRTRK